MAGAMSGARREIEGDELARARMAYRGAQESARGWRGFSPHARHHDLTYWSLLTSLFAEPGLNRTRLIERIMTYAGVSRSTAERAIRDAKDSGFVTDEPYGKEVRLFLSDSMFNHCIDYFRDYMDVSQINKLMGYPDR